jgi:TRAP-type C4-dicarboxylate transport system permease small subunit
MAASSFLALAYTFGEKGHIRITLFLERANKEVRRFLDLWCLSIATFFSGFLSYYFVKMLIISIQFGERSEGADEIYIWIPQVTVALGSTIFFICVLHNFILVILNRNNN